MKLPPLATLRAFEAAARRTSFSLAGQELGMTATAVSQHVRNLEAWLGVALFERHARGVRLTPAGREFGLTVSSGLRQIASGAERISCGRDRMTVRLASLPSVVAHFLTPRLPRFRALYPDIQVSISYSGAHHAVSADLTIGHGVVSGENAVALFSAETRPTCAPSYAAEFGPFDDVDSLLRAELLHDDTETAWQNWFAADGISLPDNAGPVFADFNLLVTALKAGQGVGLCPTALLHDEIANGQLTVLFDRAADTEKYYWLMEAEEMTAPARILSDWLVAEARESETRRNYSAATI
ncbi:LysR family transcriptional regulator [Agrobacterium tumefaciens]|uniref:LysR substrate-binding domain-containing protein n=1 Tax=Agrobacterium tumefaciens TaxID=358 RepID=UPI000DD53273|nr:LysR substrate-binding domain-containing protein [Agrobacterium tumefaciens]NUL16368.1 LysR family transcriptional regulator [Agrobacterium tumefaciens]UXS09023.1 LysR family transcriptional regulator [Agrobacterium tumefaciens]UXS16384.1 LysR family transcriptional regulator [Agrobacterium tumefaciens]UXT65036.1 LysR family transcriptional regulator [Agrobacterium tumefaciens]